MICSSWGSQIHIKQLQNNILSHTSILGFYLLITPLQYSHLFCLLGTNAFLLKEFHKNKTYNKLRLVWGFLFAVLLSCSKPIHNLQLLPQKIFDELYFVLGPCGTMLKPKILTRICLINTLANTGLLKEILIHVGVNEWRKRCLDEYLNNGRKYLKYVNQNQTDYHTVYMGISFSMCPWVYTFIQMHISTYLVSLWSFIATRKSLTVSGLWYLQGVFEMYFNVCKG